MGKVRNKSTPLIVAILLVVFPTAGLYFMSIGEPSGKDKQIPVAGSNVFYLSPSELADLKSRAFENDGDAALRVSRYYVFYDHNPELSNKWLELSANSGNLSAQYNLGLLLLEADRAKAVSWLEMAAASGYEKAASYLNKLKAELGDSP